MKKWRVRYEGSEDMPFSVTEEHPDTGTMHDYICRIVCWKNQKGNAQMIAAAPDMLEALECLIESFHESVIANHDYFPAIKKAIEAVNKATNSFDDQEKEENV